MDTKHASFSFFAMSLLIIYSIFIVCNSNAELEHLSQLIDIIPTWDDDVNITDSCSLQNIDREDAAFIFNGDQKIFCSLNITVLDGLTIAIEMPAKTSSDLFHLFYESDDNLQKRYVVINRQEEQCFVTISHPDQLKMYLLGNTSLLLRFVLSDAESNCFVDMDNKPSGVRDRCMPKCNNVYKYANLVTCASGLNGEFQSGESCRLSFPNRCNIVLRYREAVMKRGKRDQPNEKFLVIYPNVAKLDLSRNKIVDVVENTFQGLQDLEILNLAENLLEHLPNALFHDLPNLKKLNLSDNQLAKIKKVMFETLNQLTVLNLKGNALTHVDEDSFENLTNLTNLYLYENNLTTLPVGIFSNLYSMEILYLQGNQFTLLDSNIFQDMRNLEILDLSTNKLATLHDTIFRGLGTLVRLYLSQNALSSVSEDLFHGLKSLKTLWLNDNQLHDLPSGFFHGLFNLKRLNIDENQLLFLNSSIFHDLQHLNILTLSGNNLKFLPIEIFAGLENLEILDLDRNELATLSDELFQNLSNLIHLNLAFNAIETLSNDTFNDLSSLKVLSLGYNKLSILHNGVFNVMGNLFGLVMHHNLLTQIESKVFSSMANLIFLNFGYNPLKEAHREWFQDMVYLEMLVLGNCPGIKLDSNIFDNLLNLSSLSLAGNKHQNIDIHIFQETLRLNYLNLSDNRFQNIPDIRHLNQLTYLDLQYNPLLEITTETFVGLPEEAELIVTQHEICDCYTPQHVNCSAAGKRSPYLTCDRLLADGTLLIIMWVIGLNALGGNLYVLAWRRMNSQKNKVQALLLNSLAMSDLLMGMYMIIVASADVYFGDNFPLRSESWRSSITCKVAGTLSILSSEASVFFVTLISIDRFINIRFPFSSKKINHKSAIVIVTLTWIASLVLGIIPSVLAGRSFKFYDNSHVCIGLPLALTEVFNTEESNRIVYKGDYWYNINVFNTKSQGFISGMYFSTAVFLGLNLLCYLTIFVCYFEIVQAVYKSSKRAGLNKEMKEQLSMTIKVAAIVTTDFACWFPIIMLGILVQARVITLPPSAFAWCVTFVLPINSAINPYLYTISAIVSNRKRGGVSVTRRHGLSMSSRNVAAKTHVSCVNKQDTEATL